MGTPEPGVRRCPVCGYGLTGLPEQGGRVRCPECGAEQELAKFQSLPPWPSKLKIILYLVGTPLILAGLTIGLFLIDNSVGFAILLILTLPLGIIAPLVTAIELVYRHATERDRSRLLWLLFLGGLVLNLLIVAVCVGFVWMVFKLVFSP